MDKYQTESVALIKIELELPFFGIGGGGKRSCRILSSIYCLNQVLRAADVAHFPPKSMQKCASSRQNNEHKEADEIR